MTEKLDAVQILEEVIEHLVSMGSDEIRYDVGYVK